MDGMTLIAEAQAAGLVVLADGEKLIVRGPESAGAVALRLLARKADVMAALGGVVDSQPDASQDGEGPQRGAEPAEPCGTCGAAIGWRDGGGVVTCATCSPKPLDGERVLLVNLPGGDVWRIYADERREHERRTVRLGKSAGDEPRRGDEEPTADDVERVNRALDEAAVEAMENDAGE